MKLLLATCFLLLCLQSTSAQKYNKAEAQKMVRYAYATYCSGRTLKRWTCEYCTGKFKLNYRKDDGEHSAFVGYDAANQEIVISFRGTSNTENWIDDAQFWKADDPFVVDDAYVEDGFHEVYTALQTDITEAALSLVKAHPKAKLLVTGHSLGGAVASLCALDMAYTHDLDVHLYTFGSPRAGDDGFQAAVAKYVKKSHRLVNHKDPVPHLPPQSLDYRHVQTEFWADEAGKTTFQKCTASLGEENDSCANSISAIDYDFDHHKNYVGVQCCECADAPQITAVTAPTSQSKKVQLQWTLDSEAGTATHFLIKSKVSSRSSWRTPHTELHASMLTQVSDDPLTYQAWITGLRENTQYDFRVLARNKHGMTGKKIQASTTA